MAKHKSIPINQQDANAIGGIEVRHIQLEKAMELDVSQPHMDDHYIIMLIISGTSVLHLEMDDIEVTAGGLLIIKPLQVHAVKRMGEDSSGFFVSFESFLMPSHLQGIFNGLTPSSQYIKIPDVHWQTLVNTVTLLQQAFDAANMYKGFVLNGLFSAYIHLAAGLYTPNAARPHAPQNQSAATTAKFWDLIERYSFLQLPSFYADKLNITTAHLNHCLKTVTGFSITHTLQEAMLTEAKKQIYYTDNNIKQIAFSLGYDDHTYFARIFKKLTGETPMAFRNKFRE